MINDVLTRVYEMTGKAGTICPNVPVNPNPSPNKLCRGNFDDEAMVRYLIMSQEDLDNLEGNNYTGLDITEESTLPINQITNWHDYIMYYQDASGKPAGSMENPRYKQYLRSGAWKRKKAMVMKLAERSELSDPPRMFVTYDRYGRRIVSIKAEWRPICEKEECSNTAEDVHHLTYENVGKENLEDLQALCKDCHYREHNQGRQHRRFVTLDGLTVMF